MEHNGNGDRYSLDKQIQRLASERVTGYTRLIQLLMALGVAWVSGVGVWEVSRHDTANDALEQMIRQTASSLAIVQERQQRHSEQIKQNSDDISKYHDELNTQIGRLHDELDTKINADDTLLNAKIDNGDGVLDNKINSVNGDLNQKIDGLRNQLYCYVDKRICKNPG